MQVKVYLDDERTAPEGWLRVKTPAQCIALLETGMVSHLSLDHDLGDDEGIGTGYDVVLWLEQEVFLNSCGHGNSPDLFRDGIPETIQVHSANVSARIKMEQGIKKIFEWTQKKC